MITEKFEACILGGAIGDAWGSSYENEINKDQSSTFYLSLPEKKDRSWSFTDDTGLTLATCEALCENEMLDPAILSNWFLRYYHQKRLPGLGASTLKAIRELEMGGHWSQVGRSGEYAAGNGAAMRIAPLAFFKNVTREQIKNCCIITHKNDEAYIGALAIVLSIRAILDNEWNGNNNLFDIIIPQLPDTNVRDRLIQINSLRNSSIADISKLGNNGYVVNSVPFSLFAASQVNKIGLADMFQSIIDSGGDTDTNASIAGQIAGTLIGLENFPTSLLEKLKTINGYNWLIETIRKTKAKLNHTQQIQ